MNLSDVGLSFEELWVQAAQRGVQPRVQESTAIG